MAGLLTNNVKISELSELVTVSGNELIPIANRMGNASVTIDKIKKYTNSEFSDLSSAVDALSKDMGNAEQRIANNENTILTLQDRLDNISSTAVVPIKSYTIHNTMQSANGAGQKINIHTGHLIMRVYPTWTGRLTIYADTGSVMLLDTTVVENESKIVEFDSVNTTCRFRTWVDADFYYDVEEVEIQNLEDVADRVGVAEEKLDDIEKVVRVKQTYGVYNQHNGVGWETQWFNITAGHYIFRVNFNYNGTLYVYDTAVKCNATGSEVVRHIYTVHTGENIIEMDVANSWLGWRTYQDGKFYYAVEDIEFVDAKSSIERLNPLLRTVGSWQGKVMATYGDSVTAINNGNWTFPYKSENWGNLVASYLNMSKQYGRGVGSQMYKWTNGGGAAVVIDESTGAYVSRNNQTKDTYTGTLEDGQIVTRGAGCSWDRITKMFPTDVKDTIDVVLVMYHNDADTSNVGAEFEWVTGSTTDPEWANSEQYANYGGDYNITTVKGGIASTVMKLQAWMPNAVIVLMTPISGRGTTGQKKMTLKDANMELLADVVRDMGKQMSIPVIDVNANCGINGLNREKYISDSIHPYLIAGQRMIARAIIGGMTNIMPMINGL